MILTKITPAAIQTIASINQCSVIQSILYYTRTIGKNQDFILPLTLINAPRYVQSPPISSPGRPVIFLNDDGAYYAPRCEIH